ncbi:MAG: hypothetical protein ABEJ95_04730 [Candidatus Nanohalobium sp.]
MAARYILLGAAVVIAAAILIPEPAGKKVYTVDEVIEAKESLEGQTLSVKGETVKGSVMCTKMYCTDENPCCNICSSSVKLKGNKSIALEGEDIGCSGTNCEMNCTPTTGKRYIVTGILKQQNSHPYIETSSLRRVNQK